MGWIVGFGIKLFIGLGLRAWLSASPTRMGGDMECDSNAGEKKVITAGELVVILGQYHSAIARLGSGIISLSGALKHSEDAEVKQAADDAWIRLNEFIDCMEGVADGLNALTRKEEAANGE
ncbi:hypothetical protein HX864_03530 [Pseudomonas yamanorum]|uniref:hypothetical protein n=1 Tax=Pseudomonas yamanorum TaxID=515393 RepID=UPI0015A06129|nr:hypothetical protein [Pseudomonas yamanorum]NWD22323.1 hypothetical protein [Pseudomonas yamanorum]